MMECNHSVPQRTYTDLTLWVTYYNGLIWSSWCLKSGGTRLFVQQYFCWGVQQRQHQISTLLTICEGNPPLVDSPHKGPVTTGWFPSHRASNRESPPVSWTHPGTYQISCITWLYYAFLHVYTIKPDKWVRYIVIGMSPYLHYLIL